MRFAHWLDATIGPPWSGLVMLAMIGALCATSAWATVETVNYVFRDKP